MATQAQYNLSTGVILATLIGNGITDPNQISAMKAAGVGVTLIPDGKNASTGQIDLANGQYIDVTPAAPVPNILIQDIAARINAGLIAVSAYHPQTIAEINIVLKNANMAMIPTS